MSDFELGNRNGQEEEKDFADMWEALNSEYDYISPSRGDIREGIILQKRPDEIILDIGVKRDAIVPSYELQRMDPEELRGLKVGDKVHVYIVRPTNRDGNLIVSLRMARQYEDWIKAQELMDSGEIVTCTITGYNKGGLLCSFGTLQGFVPASQIANTPQRGARGDLSEYEGEEMRAKVIEVNRRRRRLILSERAAQREWRAQQREQLLEELAPGQVRSGIISSIRDFGAFVDLGGIDGLIHISELSWSRIKHPSEVVNVGDKVDVEVLNVDLDRQRIGLSLKRTRPDPWASVEERYQPGQVTEGTVVHVVDFGAFVELEPGVEGLVHISELEQGATAAENVVREGQKVSVEVLNVEPERHRIGLSLRRVPEELQAPQVAGELEAPEEQASEEAPEEPAEEKPEDVGEAERVSVSDGENP
ncbi:MAG: S1 RNA-binding domain-containing protein [Chloroflexi bacterium]|jgi:small subunit ribosomal protein S1|nr:S1 RNA-binding domain-containing protein [Chloroflexota bacterium]